MKILILSQYWHPENGVPQRRWSWLANILAEAGHEITAIAPPPHYQRKMGLKQWFAESRRMQKVSTGPAGEKIARSGFIPTNSSLTNRALNQAWVAMSMLKVALCMPPELRGYRPDLVIGTVPALPTAIITGMVARLLKTPYIIDLRDAWPDLLNHSGQWNRGTGTPSLRQRLLSKGPLQFVSRIIRTGLHQTLRKSSGIIVTSARLQQNLTNRSAIQTNGVSPEVITIRNVFPPEAQYIAVEKNDYSADELNVLYAGTLGRAQHLTNAIKAVKLAKEQGVKVNLRLVGAGAAKTTLQHYARERGITVSFESRRPADKLDEYYDWADTSLVHLTDWEPLTRTVPSKTYELMAARVHISAVVAGETADLIRTKAAGEVVSPERPQELADLWVKLAQNRSLLSITGDGDRWVEEEREEVVPALLLPLIERVGAGR